MKPLDMEKFLRARGWKYAGAGNWTDGKTTRPLETAYRLAGGRP